MMLSLRLFLAALGLCLLPFFSLVANANDIFSDGFESGNFSSWTSSGPNWDTVKSGVPYAHSGSVRAEVKGSIVESVLLKQISTSGYHGITLSYWYRIGERLEEEDHVFIEWFDGSSWNLLEDFSDVSKGDWLQKSYVLPSSSENNSNFGLRFRATLGAATSDIFRLDDVFIQGDTMGELQTSTPSPTTTPLPSSGSTQTSTSTPIPTVTPALASTPMPTLTTTSAPAPTNTPTPNIISASTPLPTHTQTPSPSSLPKTKKNSSGAISFPTQTPSPSIIQPSAPPFDLQTASSAETNDTTKETAFLGGALSFDATAGVVTLSAVVMVVLVVLFKFIL